MSKFKLRNRLKNRLDKTKLKVYDDMSSLYEKLGWVKENTGELAQNTNWLTGNTTELIQKINTGLEVGGATLGASYTARSAGLNLLNGMEDLCNEEYGCLGLDCLGLCCDAISTTMVFLPRNRVTNKVLAGCAATSQFTRTVRDKYQEKKATFGIKK